MAKITPGNVAPNAVPQSRGGMVVRFTRSGIVAQAWPPSRGKSKSGYGYYHEKEFGIAARWASTPLDLDLQTAIEMVKETTYVPRDFLMRAMYGRAYQIISEDGFHWPNIRDVTNNPQYMLDQVTAVVGSVLYRAEIGWVGLPIGDAGDALLSNGVTPHWGPVSGGGGGGSAWELISHVNIAAPVANVTFIDLDHDELIVMYRELTASAATVRRVLASVDNGVTFFSTSGNYQQLTSTGSIANVSQMTPGLAAGSAAQSMAVQIKSAKLAGVPKLTTSPQASDIMFVGSFDPINAIKVDSTSGTLNAGDIYLLGKP
jgi:hypothetical protein